MLCIQDFEASNFCEVMGKFDYWIICYQLLRKKKAELLVCQQGVNQWFSTFRATHMTLASF
jgi:hypothetical protein